MPSMERALPKPKVSNFVEDSEKEEEGNEEEEGDGEKGKISDHG